MKEDYTKKSDKELRRQAIGKAHIAAEARFINRIFNASYENKEQAELEKLINKSDRSEVIHFLEDHIG